MSESNPDGDTEQQDGLLPNGETVEQRARRVTRAVRGCLAAVLCLEAFVVLLVPRTIAQTSTGLNGTKTGLLIVFAVLLVVVGAMLRRPWGIAAGSVAQLAVIATGFLVGVMFFVGVLFLAIWVYALNIRHELIGTPGGVRMLYSP